MSKGLFARRIAQAATGLGLLLAASTGMAQDACLNDVNQFNNAVCTAKDVRVAKIEVVEGPGVCIEGETVEIPELKAYLVGTAKERYDIGIFIASDGGDAKMSLSGNNDGCYHDFLEPEDYPNLDRDMCGDIKQRSLETKTLEDVAVLCQDTDDDGYLDVGTCLSWENNKTQYCAGVEDAIPGTPSKCRCEPIQVGMIPVEPMGSITVYKEVQNLSDDVDPGTEFPVAISDGTAGNLIGGGDPLVAEGLDAGEYTITESLPDGWVFDSVLCDRQVDIDEGSDEVTVTLELEEDDDATCTFTNEPEVFK